MTRLAFIRHLMAHGQRLIAESERHSWWGAEGRRSAVPRQAELSLVLVRKICAGLGVHAPG